MRQRRVVTALAIPLALAFVAASCGSDDSSSDTDTGGETTEATETETETTEGGDDGEDAAPATVPDVDTSVAPEEAEAVYGGTVTIGLEADATGLRPWEDSCSSPCYTIMRSIYDPLFDQTSEGTYEPFLAESIESNEDFTVWTMTLRPGVTQARPASRRSPERISSALPRSTTSPSSTRSAHRTSRSRVHSRRLRSGSPSMRPQQLPTRRDTAPTRSAPARS